MGEIKAMVSALTLTSCVLALTGCIAIQPAPRPSATVGHSAQVQPSASLNPDTPRPSANPGLLPPIPGGPVPWPSGSARPLPSQAPTPEPTPALSSYPVEVVAGSGEQGFKDGPALQASFNSPWKPCLDPRDGSLYIPDTHKLRKLTPDGQVVTVAGGAEAGYRDGAATEARFNFLISCVVDSQGAVLLADRKNRRIRKLMPDGQVTTFLGTGAEEVQDGDLAQAAFSDYLTDLVFLPSGELFITDEFRLRRFHQARLTTLNAGQSYGADHNYYQDGPITASGGVFGDSLRVTADQEGNMYLADKQVRRIRRVDRSGIVTTISISQAEAIPKYGAEYWKHAFDIRPTGITYDPVRNRLFVCADGGQTVFQADLTGDMTIISGNSLAPLGTDPLFQLVVDGGITMGKDGKMYVVDSGSHQIKRIFLPRP